MPETTVNAILTSTDGVKILLTRRRSGIYAGMWCLPGGHIDHNEKALDAVIREVKEETGLNFVSPRFFSPFDEIIPEHDIHTITLVFAGKAVGHLSPSPDEVSELRWTPFSEIDALPFAFRHKDIIQAYAANMSTT